MRVLIIWVMGIVSLSIIGSLIGFALTKEHAGSNDGAIAGACAFTCLRLWFSPPSQKSN